RQLGTAMLLYTQDYDEVLPSMWDNTAGNGQSGGWIYYCCFPNGSSGNFDPARGTLIAYIRNVGIFTCPSDGARQGDSYAINALLGSPVGRIGFHTGLPLAALAAPASTFLFIEESNGDARNSTDDGYLLPPGNVGS